jgi:hypothetical protein
MLSWVGMPVLKGSAAARECGCLAMGEAGRSTGGKKEGPSGSWCDVARRDGGKKIAKSLGDRTTLEVACSSSPMSKKSLLRRRF